ncbi:uncharacterized protein MONOS_18125 [Monocercomonoides exilis]|nr:hypothetical protein MONOS_18125 [Monocercomonoides exilis]
MEDCFVKMKNGREVNYSFVIADGGKVIVKNLSISGAGYFVTKIGTTPLVEIIRSSGVTIENCDFMNISHAERDGAWIAISCIEKDSELRVEKCTFEVCRADGEQGMGGGVRLCGEEGVTVEVSGCRFRECKAGGEVSDRGKSVGGGMFIRCKGRGSGMKLTSVEFEHCDAWKGKNVFVLCSDIASIVQNKSMNFEFKLLVEEKPELDELSGSEANEEGELDVDREIVPLVVALREFCGTCFVGEEGADNKFCGYKDYPCKSLEHGGKARFEMEEMAVISFLPSFSICKPLIRKSQAMCFAASDCSIPVMFFCDVQQEDGGASEEFKEGEEGFVETGKEVIFQNMLIRVKCLNALKNKYVFAWIDESLHLTDCKVSCFEGEASCGFSRGTKGKLVLKRVEMNGIKWIERAVIAVCGSECSCEMDECIWSGTGCDSEKGILWASGDSSIAATNTYIGEWRDGKCSAICIEESREVKIENMTLKGIEKEGGDGEGKQALLDGGRVCL